MESSLRGCLTRPQNTWHENIIMDGNAVLMRQMATMTKETDTSTHRHRAQLEEGCVGEGRGVTCIKLLIRFVGSREGEKWLCGSRVKVFVTGAFSIVARKFFEAAHELWRAAAHCQSWWRRRRRCCCCLSLSAPLSASQFFICLSVQLCVCV